MSACRIERARDIPQEEIVAAVRAVRGRNGVDAWATTWDLVEHLAHFPSKAVLARVRKLVKRGVLGGHVCSLTRPYCRGDIFVVEDSSPSGIELRVEDQ